MAKMRVYELAKELGIENKEVLAVAAEKNISVTSASSGLDDDQVKEIKAAFGKGSSKPAGGEDKKKEKKAQ